MLLLPWGVGLHGSLELSVAGFGVLDQAGADIAFEHAIAGG